MRPGGFGRGQRTRQRLPLGERGPRMAWLVVKRSIGNGAGMRGSPATWAFAASAEVHSVEDPDRPATRTNQRGEPWTL